MLSRVAENLFWFGRYFERLEHDARLLDAARRMSMMPVAETAAPSNEWSSVLVAAGGRRTFPGDIETAAAQEAVNHLVSDPANPSSVFSCLKAARDNARAVRASLTTDVWEATNDARDEFRAMRMPSVNDGSLTDFIDWAKAKAARVRGAVEGTLARDDALQFIRLGWFVERADSTARILDVKYHLLLPSVREVGGGVDHYQWASLLQATGTLRTFQFVTHDHVNPKGVASFLILQPKSPRSLRYSYSQIDAALGALEALYGERPACRSVVEEMLERLLVDDIQIVLDAGLHEFLTDFISANYRVSDAIGASFGFGLQVTEAEANGAGPTKPSQ
ncbi:MAG: alpha-E domain-containing protein [Pseudomonadota bacterium]